MTIWTWKERPRGFLAGDKIDHASEQFGYIQELHAVLWRFIRAEYPNANGELTNWVPAALASAEARRSKTSS